MRYGTRGDKESQVALTTNNTTPLTVLTVVPSPLSLLSSPFGGDLFTNISLYTKGQCGPLWLDVCPLILFFLSFFPRPCVSPSFASPSLSFFSTTSLDLVFPLFTLNPCPVHRLPAGPQLDPTSGLLSFTRPYKPQPLTFLFSLLRIPPTNLHGHRRQLSSHGLESASRLYANAPQPFSFKLCLILTQF